MIRNETTFYIGKNSNKFCISSTHGYYITATTKRISDIESFRHINSKEPVFLIQIWFGNNKKITDIIIVENQIYTLIELILFDILKMHNYKSEKLPKRVPNIYRTYVDPVYSNFTNTQSYFISDHNGLQIKRISNDKNILTLTEKNNLKIKFLLWIFDFIQEVFGSKTYIAEKKMLLKSIGYNNLLIEKINNVIR